MLEWLSTHLITLVLFAGAAVFVSVIFWLDGKCDELKEFRVTPDQFGRLPLDSLPHCQIGRRTYRGILKYRFDEDGLYLRMSRFPAPPRFYCIPYKNLKVAEALGALDMEVFTSSGTLNAYTGPEFARELRRRPG